MWINNSSPLHQQFKMISLTSSFENLVRHTEHALILFFIFSSMHTLQNMCKHLCRITCFCLILHWVQLTMSFKVSSTLSFWLNWLFWRIISYCCFNCCLSSFCLTLHFSFSSMTLELKISFFSAMLFWWDNNLVTCSWLFKCWLYLKESVSISFCSSLTF